MESKKYIVIGGSSGIGLSIVNQLTSGGHQVEHFARNEGDWPEKDLVTHHTLDITSGKFPEEDVVESASGMVYCPGTINLKSFQQLKEEDFRNDLEINLMGAVRAVKLFYKALRKGKPSSIVFFSTVAVNPGMAFHTSIGAAKGAVEGMARSMAAEFAPNIRVNVVAPSLTDTPLAEKLMGSEDRREASKKRHILGRLGRPEDIANMAVYLLSEKAGWITGQVIGVDGGIGRTR